MPTRPEGCAPKLRVYRALLLARYGRDGQRTAFYTRESQAHEVIASLARTDENSFPRNPRPHGKVCSHGPRSACGPREIELIGDPESRGQSNDNQSDFMRCFYR